jgi:hypothetical protein
MPIWKTAHHQIYATNAANGGEEGDPTPRSSRRRNLENSASNHDSDYTIAEEEWVAARAAIFNNTPLPTGTSVGTLNRQQLSNEQASLELRLLAADQSSE